MFIQFNANPSANRVGDCSVRAISKATGKNWEEVYIGVCLQGLMLHDMPSSNYVWGNYLESIGYERHMISTRGYTVEDFCKDYPEGSYILAISGHVVACVDGRYFDTWDSGNEVVVYYWRKAHEQFYEPVLRTDESVSTDVKPTQSDLIR